MVDGLWEDGPPGQNGERASGKYNFIQLKQSIQLNIKTEFSGANPSVDLLFYGWKT